MSRTAILVLIALMALVGWGIVRSRRAAVVHVLPVRRTTVVRAVYATGRVEPRSEVDVRATRPGVVRNVRATEGSTVARDDVLLRIEPLRNGHPTARRARDDSEDEDNDFLSPVAGTVVSNLVHDGTMVVASQVLMRLADLSTPHIDAYVDESDVAQLRVGAIARVRLSPSAAPLAAHVIAIAPVIDRVRNAARVTLDLDAPGNALRPGTTVEANIIVDEHPNVLVVPADAVRDGHVWIVDASNRSTRRAVTGGARDLGSIEIVAGLTDHDRVIIDDPDTLHDGATVAPVAARPRVEASP